MTVSSQIPIFRVTHVFGSRRYSVGSDEPLALTESHELRVLPGPLHYPLSVRGLLPLTVVRHHTGRPSGCDHGNSLTPFRVHPLTASGTTGGTVRVCLGPSGPWPCGTSPGRGGRRGPSTRGSSSGGTGLSGGTPPTLPPRHPRLDAVRVVVGRVDSVPRHQGRLSCVVRDSIPPNGWTGDRGLGLPRDSRRPSTEEKGCYTRFCGTESKK